MQNEFETVYDTVDAPYSFSEYRRERPVRKTDGIQRKDYLIRVIAVQMLLFAVLSGVLFGMYKKQTSSFIKLKELYFTISEQDFSADEITGALKKAAAFVFKPTQGTSAAEDETIDSATQEPFETTLPIVEDSLTGSGGEDIIAAKKNTSFAPFSVTAKAVLPVKNAKVTSRFGYRVNPITKVYGFHTGLDLAAAEGTDIYAAYTGTVTKAESSEARGNFIILEHGNGLKTVYCHCSELFVEVGSVIRAGERIAAVGSTGQATGPHLHFEIQLNGVWCNPEWVLDLK